MLGNKNLVRAEAFRPLKNNVFVSDLDTGPHQTAAGIIIPDDNFSERGVHPRWARVWAIGPDVQGLSVGEWVYVEHARWTNSIDMELPDGTVRIWKVDWPEAVLLATDTDPRQSQATMKEVTYPQSEEHHIRSKSAFVHRFN